MGRGGRYGHRPGLRARAPGRHPPDGFLGRLDPGRSRADWCGDDGRVRRRRSGRRRLPSLARRFRSHHGDAPLVRPGPAPLVAVPRRGRYPVGSGVGGRCPGLRPLDAVGNGVRQPEELKAEPWLRPRHDQPQPRCARQLLRQRCSRAETGREPGTGG